MKETQGTYANHRNSLKSRKSVLKPILPIVSKKTNVILLPMIQHGLNLNLQEIGNG